MPPSPHPPRIGRRPLLAAAALGWAASRAASAAPAAAAPAPCHPASDWAAFASRHIQRDGRVIDFNTPQQQSTSEGQSYSLFFALVHNDKATFARVLAWTEANLAQGNLATNLPAWQWGKKLDGGWGVLDANAASDADLWIAYALMEAGRLWNEPRYARLGRSLLALVARDEVVALPGLGRMLLPWPASVASGPLWRLNPSYMPLQLLRYFQQTDPRGPWREVADTTVRLLHATAPKGFAPDWCAWSSAANAFVADPQKGVVGSYDAIRVYLWAGMLSARDPESKALLQRLNGPRLLLADRHQMPESVDTATGTERGKAPLGFTGALLPYLKAQDLPEALAAESARVPGGRTDTSSAAAPAAPLPYYEQVLLIFGQAWLDGRYEFDRNGQLQTSWRLLCRPSQAA
ncbi:cellulose synthase complex periplasmic endoglucanase BcsZ [Variovorax sp. RKNM96]|uniref:cellulose synthase complex periplasmic endoglucanase BcsZ n=1 Tax=Variovorax sp. RKNM96 TaxID=2681552 RepID=UPI001F126734|nr:cellulose synthase complex periplasmic endoglucanase BcsZ [Variovorax sp. RKNM96]